MEHSNEIGELASALAKAQGQMRAAIKDSTNPHFKNRYADLASVWDAIREPLSSNGISVVQAPGECADGYMALTTMMLHASGQWMRQTLTIPLSKVDAQGYGSAATYAKRYALSSFAGIAQDDDDGNAASNPNGADNRKPAAREKLDGKHSSMTALRAAIAKARKLVREAGDMETLQAVGNDYAEDIAQAERYYPAFLTGEPNLEEDIGLYGEVKARKQFLTMTGPVESPMLAELLKGLDSATDLMLLQDWHDSNHSFIDELSDADARKVEKAFNDREAGLIAVSRTNAG